MSELDMNAFFKKYHGLSFNMRMMLLALRVAPKYMISLKHHDFHTAYALQRRGLCKVVYEDTGEPVHYRGDGKAHRDAVAVLTEKKRAMIYCPNCGDPIFRPNGDLALCKCLLYPTELWADPEPPVAEQLQMTIEF